MKTIRLALLHLVLLVIGMPVYSQTYSSTPTDQEWNSKVSVFISGAVNYNPSCNEKKFGGGAGLEMEWQPVPWLGVGIGAGYSSENVYIEEKSDFSYNWSPWVYKYDSNLSLINVPLRLYAHPVEWLRLDVGIQWSYIIDKGSAKEIDRHAFSCPLGISFGSSHRIFVRYQPRLDNLMKDEKKYSTSSSPFLLGVNLQL